MKGKRPIVIYSSISGFTEKYAHWIAEDLECECCSLSDVRKIRSDDYDTLVYGGSLHAVGIAGFRILKRRFPHLLEKDVYIFATGASPDREQIPREIIGANFTEDQKERFTFQYFRGGFDYQKLDSSNRLLMSLLKIKIKLKRPENRSGDERGMLAAFDHPTDFTKRENIAGFVEKVRSG